VTKPIKDKVTALAVALLDDGEGINEKAFAQLKGLIGPPLPTGLGKILLQVKCVEGRYFLPEDYERP